jgi:hypothetical protein
MFEFDSSILIESVKKYIIKKLQHIVIVKRKISQKIVLKVMKTPKIM